MTKRRMSALLPIFAREEVQTEELVSKIGRDVALHSEEDFPIFGMKVNWRESWIMGVICLFIGVVVFLILHYGFNIDIFWAASIGVIVWFLSYLFTRNRSLINIGIFVLSSIVLTIILTLFVFLIFDLLKKYR